MLQPNDRFIVAVATVAAVGFLLTAVIVNTRNTKLAINEATTPTPPVIEEAINQAAFANLTLEARAAVVYDPVTDRIIFEQNKNTQLPIASITKLMTAIVAAESAEPNYVVASKNAFWRLADLIEYTLVSSSNEGAESLALVGVSQAARELPEPTQTFVTKMNAKAQALGLDQTYFTNPTGLDISDIHGGSYSSAQDVARLLAFGLKEHADLLTATRQPALNIETLDTAHHLAINTNTLTGEIPGLLAGKTGFTDLASGNLVVAFDRGLNQPLIIAVLGSSFNGRFSDVRQLVAASLNAF